MRIAIATAVVALSTLLFVTPADGAIRRATDREAGVRFVLDGRTLTTRILASAPRRVRRQVYGERVTAACQRYVPVVRVVDKRRWPRGDRTVRFRFDRDISRRANWCLLEHRRGGDVAFAGFGS